jgi:hypothetical protein
MLSREGGAPSRACRSCCKRDSSSSRGCWGASGKSAWQRNWPAWRSSGQRFSATSAEAQSSSDRSDKMQCQPVTPRSLTLRSLATLCGGRSRVEKDGDYSGGTIARQDMESVLATGPLACASGLYGQIPRLRFGLVWADPSLALRACVGFLACASGWCERRLVHGAEVAEKVVFEGEEVVAKELFELLEAFGGLDVDERFLLGKGTEIFHVGFAAIF